MNVLYNLFSNWSDPNWVIRKRLRHAPQFGLNFQEGWSCWCRRHHHSPGCLRFFCLFNFYFSLFHLCDLFEKISLCNSSVTSTRQIFLFHLVEKFDIFFSLIMKPLSSSNNFVPYYNISLFAFWKSFVNLPLIKD